MLFGRGMTPSGMRYRRNRMRTPTTLAFIDDRDEREVVVVTDAADGDPFENDCRRPQRIRTGSTERSAVRECFMLLAIDISNTNIKFGVYDGSTMLHHWRYPRLASAQPMSMRWC